MHAFFIFYLLLRHLWKRHSHYQLAVSLFWLGRVIAHALGHEFHHGLKGPCLYKPRFCSLLLASPDGRIGLKKTVLQKT
jgi:hypothetical protein